MTEEQRKKLLRASFRVPLPLAQGHRRPAVASMPQTPIKRAVKRQYSEAEKRVFLHLSICKRCEECQTQRGGCRGVYRGACPCHVDGKDIVVHAMTDCPKGKYLETSTVAGMDELLIKYSATHAWEKRGPLLWAELHRWAISFQGTSCDAMKWLSGFAARIGCAECRDHWRGWVAEQPPDLCGNDHLLRWTIRAHNAVNRRLGKAEMAEDAAVLHWINEGAAKSV